MCGPVVLDAHTQPHCRPLSNPPLSCRPAGWAPAIPRKTPPRLFFAKTRVSVPQQCNKWLMQRGQKPGNNFNSAVEFCVSLLDKVAFCGGDSGGALYTIGRSGGKATAFVHGIFTVRHGCGSSALWGRRGRCLACGRVDMDFKGGSVSVEGGGVHRRMAELTRQDTTHRRGRAFAPPLSSPQAGFDPVVCTLGIYTCSCDPASPEIVLRLAPLQGWIRPRIKN